MGVQIKRRMGVGLTAVTTRGRRADGAHNPGRRASPNLKIAS
jgi:hypothetical protein